jgi:hypothetical protein
MDAGTMSKPLVPKASMITIRCTKKLLRRFGASRPAGIAPMDTAPTTRLGDWHANVLYRPNAELVMFVNDRSLLPVVVPARPTDIVAMRLVEALATTLLRLGASARAVEAEIAEMTVVQIGPTRSRQILGSMTDFDNLLDHRLEPGRTLIEAGLELAAAPCGPIGMRRPRDVAIELLALGG